MSPEELAAFEREQAGKVRRADGDRAPLSQVDGGQWWSDGDDTSAIRERLGLPERVIPSEPRGYTVNADGSIVTGDNVTV